MWAAFRAWRQCHGDTSGGSSDTDNVIFCGSPWHEEFRGWQAWIDHVAPLVREATYGDAYMDGWNAGKYEDCD